MITKPIAPLVCHLATARALGATLFAEPARSLMPIDRAQTLIDAAHRVGLTGAIPVMTHGNGAVFSWPVQAGDRDTGAGM